MTKRKRVKRLTTTLKKADRLLLAHLQNDFPSKAVNRCAEVLNSDYCHYHRGAMTLRGHKIVFGNDGFIVDKDADQRSKLEVVRLVRTIDRINNFWRTPIIQISGFGLCCSGFSWAMRVKTDYFNWDGILNTAVWDAWFRACAQVTGQNVHPYPRRLTDEIQHMYHRSARAA